MALWSSASVVVVVVLLILPYAIGSRAEAEYRSTIAQMSSDAVRLSVNTYDRGWFSSTATATVDLGGRQVELTQEIYHGPFPFAGSHHSWLPVVAIVESRADLPLDLKSIIHFTDESKPALAATAFLFPGGTTEVSVTVPPFAGGNPYAATEIRFDGGQCVWQLRRGDISAKGEFEHFHYAAAGSRFDASALSFDGDLRKDPSGLWLHDGTWRLRGLDLTFAPDPDAPPLPSHLVFDDVSVAASDRISQGLVQTDTSLTMKRILLPDGNTISSKLEWQLQNLDPYALADWVSENQAIARSDMPTAGRLSELRNKAMILLIRLAKAAPKTTFKLELQGASGPSASTLQAGIKPGFGGESSAAYGGLDYQSMVRELIDNYVYASAEIVVPASLFTDLASGDEVSSLLTRGVIVREGANFASRATYSRRQIFVNGQTLQ